MSPRKVINRFNHLTSKEWLPFQKSWFRFGELEDYYLSNFRFFTKTNDSDPSLILFIAPEWKLAAAESAANNAGCRLITEDYEYEDKEIDFIFLDFSDGVFKGDDNRLYYAAKESILEAIADISVFLKAGRFLAISVNNQLIDHHVPVAWDMASAISGLLSMKDEKVGCLDSGEIFYTFYFRNDENAGKATWKPPCAYQLPTIIPPRLHGLKLPANWFILKPPPRKKNEVLHPAKYPEELASQYINIFTKKDETVMDPMCGTGSTQVAALLLNRNTIGVELSPFFSGIASERCRRICGDIPGLFENSFDIITSDIREAIRNGLPQTDYIITSPPYWDMLNMRGAENQAKRRDKGLLTNYSEDTNDLGNIAEYAAFLKSICEIYLELNASLKPGGHLTIVVKNIKKKGHNYPLAWDIAAILQQKYLLIHTGFWCQDDLSIAPYGYGYTWVSNTFHHYCLTFQKPII